jgi:hypothetical protein
MHGITAKFVIIQFDASESILTVRFLLSILQATYLCHPQPGKRVVGGYYANLCLLWFLVNGELRIDRIASFDSLV